MTEQRRQYFKQYREKNRELRRLKSAEYNSRPEVKQRKRAWAEKNWATYYAANAKAISDKARIRRQNSISARLADNIRRHTRRIIEKGFEKDAQSLEYLGCSIEQLRAHLESQFHDGMTWENYGFRGWHIDHIRPLACFDLSNDKQQRLAMHFTNLQPMWWRENLSKGSRAA